MTSKLIAVAVVLALAAPFGTVAGEVSLAAASSYYELRLRDRPSGVYEWPEEDALFVQQRLPYVDGVDSDEMTAQALAGERAALLHWLGTKASAKRVDPPLPQGLGRLREMVRRNYSDFEYTADWKCDLAGRQFSHEEEGERVVCSVYPLSAVLATLPASFLEPVGEETWLKGARQLVTDFYGKELKRSFLWQVGLLDVLESHGAAEGGVRKWAETAGEATDPAFVEWQGVEAKIAAYLKEGAYPCALRAEKTRLESRPARDTFENRTLDEKATEKAVLVATTNRVAEAFLTTNTVVRSVREADRTVAGDYAMVDEVETVTKVIRRTVLVRRTVHETLATCRFEDLFLAGGNLPNALGPRGERSLKAEKLFYGKATRAERAAAVRGALMYASDDSVLWNLQGRLLLLDKDTLGALVCFRCALALDPQNAFALANLASTYRALGCRRLAEGAAIVTLGVSSDKWCRSAAEAVLRE